MERRKFFKDVSLGIGSGLLAPQLLAHESGHGTYRYQGIVSLSDATNENGETAIRLALTNNGDYGLIEKMRVSVTGKGTVARTKSYFLEPPDQYAPRQEMINAQLFPGDVDVMVLWIKNADPETGVQIRLGQNRCGFVLRDLLKNQELRFDASAILTVNLLGYSEVGSLDISLLGVADTEAFRFAIIADPQGGDAFKPYSGTPTRIKIHNAFIVDTVERINELRPKPVFTLVLGDFVDDQGEEGHFVKMERLVKSLKTPLLLAVGNHETRYGADFSPGYNMGPLDNFFASQKRVNGTDKIAYSFDLGQWHFVVWPDPLRSNFWVNHPHYFDWLEQDLEKNKERPVVFMHHVPMHPIGIDPLTSYVESISVKQLLMNILARHGNVKYVFSGHVHIPLKASVKTAVTYKGMKMISLPPAGFRTRAFGEQDFFGGPEQGVCILDIQGENLTVNFQQVTKEWYTYPSTFREFDDRKYALWFNQPWELPLNDNLVNGDFSNGLDQWHQRYVHHEDVNPSNIRQIRTDSDGRKSLYLYSRKRDYDVSGQDRLPQHINRIAQAVSLKEMVSPLYSFSYRPEKDRYDPNSLNGFFIWMECYSTSYNVANLLYSPGKIYSGITSGFGSARKEKVYHFDLPAKVGEWQTVALPLARDFEAVDSQKRSFRDLKIDRVLLSMGTWTVNDGMGQEAGVYLRDLNFSEDSGASKLTLVKKNEDIWHKKLDHVAGDHKYTVQAEVYPEKLQGRTKPKSTG